MNCRNPLFGLLTVAASLVLLACAWPCLAAPGQLAAGNYPVARMPGDAPDGPADFGRPTMHALHVPDNFIQIDGRDDDWRRLGDDVQRYCLTAGGAAHILAPIPKRGAVTGPDDLSMIASVAYDSKYLYVLADVHDSVLLNYSDPSTPWEGDDFEVYVDANPPDKQFADSIDGDDGHYTFVPSNVSLKFPMGLVFPADKTAGVRFATRLRPFGYTIECAIPKDLLPNWKAHPGMSSVGFDLQATDADAPGLIGHDPADKGILFLLHPDFHFKSSLTLGRLEFEPRLSVPFRAVPVQARRSVKEILAALNGETDVDPNDLAQDILDRIDDRAISRLAAAGALSTHPSILRAAGLVYARRPLLSMPDGAFPNLIPDTIGEYIHTSQKGEVDIANYRYADSDDSYYAYALLALAERRQLKGDRIFYNYLMLPDPALRLTYLWCLGINGDPSIVPKLAVAYSTSTGQDKLVMAWSLGMLGDRTGAATLSDAAKNDPKSAYGQDAAVLLKRLGM